MAEGRMAKKVGLAKQKEEIEDLMKTLLHKGEIWYLVDNNWFKKWKKYVGYHIWDMDSVGQESAFPGPVDNFQLLKPNESNKLKENLIDDLDYVLVPTTAWEKLVLWYGIMEGQEPIARSVVEHGTHVKFCKVEVYLMALWLCNKGSLKDCVSKQFSRADTIKTLENVVRDTFNIPGKDDIRIWNEHMTQFLRLTHKNSTLQAAGLCHGMVLIVEQQNADGSWTLEATPTSHYTSSSSTSNISRKRKKEMENDPLKVGIPKIEEICKLNLRGKCTNERWCQRHHCDVPYQWQVLNNGRWESVNSIRNCSMESKFCDVNSEATLYFDTWGVMKLCYDDMSICNADCSLVIKIRRLEVGGEPDISDPYLIPHWSWYWKDECGAWVEYAKQNTKGNARSDFNSSNFEALFDAYKNHNGSSDVKFRAGDQQYILNFKSMTQSNTTHHTVKGVRRRPSMHLTSVDMKRCREEKPWLSNIKYPKTWDMSIRTTSYRLVTLFKNGEEYKNIESLFKKTLKRGNITIIERVQNELCWEAFKRQQEVMMKKNSFQPVEERQLFHGTTKINIEDICRDNFDFRLSGTRCGAAFGDGAYFSRCASYSDSYAMADSDEVKRMFVARVLVGSYTSGEINMRRPPYKDPSNKSLGMFDSCVDNVQTPSIFVVFDNTRVYPEYLITYSIISIPSSI
ncbi:protein mono-ADP-ribosyltransferase PARP12-like [Anneissia japonica]|uniref:protein mono-ADP-ribosyltransferase PARP12-like n=1 Tax=Anneissia japonica TaxID=1529436 RepID=UPI0014259379|nr:protein mono-ADP-ribosyltransferase PARP12-like [Anneissia japonica]